MPRISSSYTRTQIILHWAIALLILAQFLDSDAISHLMRDLGITASSSADITLGVQLHVFAGILTLVLMVVRLGLRYIAGAPALPEEESSVMKMIAHATHIILYVALFLMPISGLVGWFGQVEAALVAHNIIKVVLLAFVFLHIAGALYHQFVLKNNLIKRMTFRK